MLDATATASEQSSFDAVISMRHGKNVYFRNPHGKTEDILYPYDIALDNDFEAYQDYSSIKS